MTEILSLIDSLEGRLLQNPRVDRQAYPSGSQMTYWAIEFYCDLQRYVALIEGENSGSNHMTSPVLEIYQMKSGAISSGDVHLANEDIEILKRVARIDANDPDYIKVCADIFPKVEDMKTSLMN